jgi:hypothetical protein
MNTKKIAGFACWLAALFPFQYALLSTEHVHNTEGLIAFVGFLLLMFTGYMLVDGSSGAKDHGEHAGH